MVDQPGRVLLPDLVSRGGCVKLPPAFVERHPAGNAGLSSQVIYHLSQLIQKTSARSALLASQLASTTAPVVAHMYAHEGEKSQPHLIPGVAPAGHVLPDDDSQAVTVIVPAKRLDLHVLADHVVAQATGEFHIMAERLVGRRRVQ